MTGMTDGATSTALAFLSSVVNIMPYTGKSTHSAISRFFVEKPVLLLSVPPPRHPAGLILPVFLYLLSQTMKRL